MSYDLFQNNFIYYINNCRDQFNRLVIFFGFQNAYVPGESANVTVKITNSSTVAMDKIRIRLRRTVILRVGKRSHVLASDVSNTDQNVNILPGGEQSVAVVLLIPAGIQVSDMVSGYFYI